MTWGVWQKTRWLGGGPINIINLSSAAATWVPTDEATLAVWYDFSDGATVFDDSGGTNPAVDGDSILFVSDKSGHSAALVQNGASAVPTYETTGINSKAVALGNAATDAQM